MFLLNLKLICLLISTPSSHPLKGKQIARFDFLMFTFRTFRCWETSSLGIFPFVFQCSCLVIRLHLRNSLLSA